MLKKEEQGNVSERGEIAQGVWHLNYKTKRRIIYNYFEMDAANVAKLFDQIGLLLGFISGLLLIPEVINFLQLPKLQKYIEYKLSGFDNWAKRFPQKFYPPSWKHKFTEEQKESIEPKTAIRSFIFSLVWISILIWGILSSRS